MSTECRFENLLHLYPSLMEFSFDSLSLVQIVIQGNHHHHHLHDLQTLPGFVEATVETLPKYPSRNVQNPYDNLHPGPVKSLGRSHLQKFYEDSYVTESIVAVLFVDPLPGV